MGAGRHPRPGGKTFPRPDDRAYLLVPAGAQGRVFDAAEFPRDHEIQPGRSLCACHRLSADWLRGGEPFAQPWLRHERVLSGTERYELQQHLAQRGYDVGEPDGRVGGRPAPQSANTSRRSAKFPTALRRAVLERLRGQ